MNTQSAPHQTGALRRSEEGAASAAIVEVGMRLFSVGVALFLGLWSLIWMPIASVAAFIWGDRVGLAFAKHCWAPALCWSAGARLDVRGLENVDWSKPSVIVVNHQSMTDIPVLQHALPINLRFIFKAELLNVPLLGQYLTAVGMIPVDRSNTAGARARLKVQAQRIANDCAATLAFAEGTRSRTGALLPFKKGAFILAIESQVQVVPVSVEGTRNIISPDGFRVRPGVVRVDVGVPIQTRGLTLADRDALMAQAQAAVAALNVGAGGLGESAEAAQARASLGG